MVDKDTVYLNRGKLFILTGMSGAGKTMVANEIRRRYKHIFSPISLTTRKPRTVETSGVEYQFVSYEELQKLHESGELLFLVKHYRNFHGMKRGPIEDALNSGRDVFFETVIEAVPQIKKVYPDPTVVFLKPSSQEVQHIRLFYRGSTEEELEAKIAHGKEDEAMAKQDNITIIISDTPLHTIAEIERLFFS